MGDDALSLKLHVPRIWLAAQEVNPDKAIEAIRRNRWYDQEQRDFAPPRDLADPDTPLRRSDWLNKPRVEDPGSANATTGSTASSGWFNWLSGFNSQWLNYLLIAGLGVLLTLIVVLLSYSSLRSWMPGRFRKREELKAAQIDLAKVVDLPFEVKSTRRDPLGEAEALMRFGRYDEAIIFLFGYILLALDQSSLIQLQRGKTNRMYLRELKGRNALRLITERTMLAFEDVFFGRYGLSRDRFMEVWNQLPAFHEQLHPQGTPSPGRVSPS